MRTLRILYPLFLLSGFCGLIYESIWASYLKLFLGHAAYAQAVVLVVFIGGMAIGAWMCGRFAYRFRNPLAAYAIAEFAIGVAAMLFHRIFVGATDWAYASLLPAACSNEGLCYASWVFAALLILPQSILLGTTFPLMAAGIMRRAPEAAGRIIATLYFVNSLGAVFGVLAATFVLVPAIGLPGASLTAGLMNVLLAGAVFLCARSSVPPPPVPAPSIVTTRPGTTRATTLLIVALLTGLTSFVYEVVWIRMLSLVLGSSTHAFEIMLASFILGLALGGAWIRGRIDRLADSRRFLGNVQIAMGLLAVSTLALYNQMYEVMAWLLRTLARNDSGYVVFNVGSSVIAMIIMLPATLMAGMTLPLITQLLMRTQEGERSIGKVYGWNTFGGIVGVLLAVHLGLPHLGLKMSLGVAAFVDLALGIYLLTGAATAGRWPRPAMTAAALVAFAALLTWGDIDPHRITASVYRSAVSRLPSAFEILYVAHGKTSTITVFEDPHHIRSIQTNGKPDASIDVSRAQATSDEHTQTLVAALPFAIEPEIKDVAIIGHGSGMTTTAVLAQPGVARVDTIEIEPAMVEGARFFRPLVDAAFADKRSHLIYDDARSYLARSGRRYDLIISEPSNPWVSGVSSLFTQEFYGRMKQALHPHGVLVQWVQIYETNDRTFASIVRALGAVFRDFDVYRNSGDLIIVARADGTTPALHDDMFGHPRVREMLAHLGVASVTDLETRRVSGRRTLGQLVGAPAQAPNSDYFPVVDNNAAKARFKNEHVDSVVALPTLPLPVVDLFERRSWSGSGWPSEHGAYAGVGLPSLSSQAAVAVRVMSAALASGKPDGELSQDLVAGASAMRAIFVECASAQVSAGLMDPALMLASIIDRSLPPSVASNFWDLLASQPCAKRYPDRARWLAQFNAVARRDLPAIAQLSQQLLEDRRPEFQTEYLVLSAYVGLRADGRLAPAEALIARWKDQLTADFFMSPAVRIIASMVPDGAPRE